MKTVRLTTTPMPSEVAFRKTGAGGSKVDCLDCGREWLTAARDRAEVWTYEADNEGGDIWVRATCLDCGRVEVFETTGGKLMPNQRSFQDLDRKHRDAHGAWKASTQT